MSDEDLSAVESYVKMLSKSITIDRSYVEFSENKHEKTFISEIGWNDLCKMV